MTRGAALDYASDGIRVNSLRLGLWKALRCSTRWPP